MRVLILCEKLDIDYTSSGIGRSKLIYALSNSGYEIDVLFDQFHKADVQKVADVNFIRLNKPKNIYSTLSPLHKIGALLNYIIGQNFGSLECISWWKKNIKELLSKHSYDVIYVLGSGQQWYTFFAMNDIKTNIPIVLNFHDPYPSSYHPEFKRSIHWVEKLRYIRVKKLTQRAFKVTVPSSMLAEYLCAYYPLNNKYVIVPHGGLLLPYIKINEKEERKKLTISHLGLLLSSRNPQTFVSAFDSLFEKYPEAKKEIVLNIIGPFNIKNPDLKRFLEGQEWIRFSSDRISYPESMQLLNQSDVLLLIDFDADFSPIMLGKLGDYFYFNKPIIALTPKKSETSRLLGNQYPYKTDVKNKDEQIKIIENIYLKWKANDLNTIDLSQQKNYVSEQNIARIFQNEIIDNLKVDND